MIIRRSGSCDKHLTMSDISVAYSMPQHPDPFYSVVLLFRTPSVSRWWGIFSGTEVAVVAYLDSIHELVSIISIVFIGRGEANMPV